MRKLWETPENFGSACSSDGSQCREDHVFALRRDFAQGLTHDKQSTARVRLAFYLQYSFRSDGKHFSSD